MLDKTWGQGQELNAPTHGPAAEAHAAKSGQAGVDYTATASIGSGAQAQEAQGFENRSLLYNR